MLKDNRMIVGVKENYVSVFVVIVLILSGVVFYYITRSPLVIKKEEKRLVRKEGGISEMIVAIMIKNRGQHKISDIELTDVVPRLVAVSKEGSIGSIQPDKILHHKRKGSLIRWKIDNLDVSEERVLSYKIKSKLSILGNINLPVAKATFKYNFKNKRTTSNVLKVNN